MEVGVHVVNAGVWASHESIVHRSFIHRHLDLRADVYAAADQPSAAATATTATRQSLEADNLNLRATIRRQTQHISDLETRLSELLGEQAYARTGLGGPQNHAALEEQNHTLQNEIQELHAKLQDQEEELGAAREANRQLIGQLNKTEPNDNFDARRGTIQDADCQDCSGRWTSQGEIDNGIPSVSYYSRL